MRLLNKGKDYFKVQSDKLIGYNVFKCNLVEEGFDRDEESFPINKEHLKPLPNISAHHPARGEYGKIFEDNDFIDYDTSDKILLHLTFNENGIVFNGVYNIDIVTGEVEFNLFPAYIHIETFKAPGDMDAGLLIKIKKALNSGEILVLMNDAKLNSYVTNKYMQCLIDYVKYLETLKVNLCKDCTYKYKYALTKICKELYERNKYVKSAGSSTDDE